MLKGQERCSHTFKLWLIDSTSGGANFNKLVAFICNAARCLASSDDFEHRGFANNGSDSRLFHVLYFKRSRLSSSKINRNCFQSNLARLRYSSSGPLGIFGIKLVSGTCAIVLCMVGKQKKKKTMKKISVVLCGWRTLVKYQAINGKHNNSFIDNKLIN